MLTEYVAAVYRHGVFGEDIVPGRAVGPAALFGQERAVGPPGVYHHAGGGIVAHRYHGRCVLGVVRGDALKKLLVTFHQLVGIAQQPCEEFRVIHCLRVVFPAGIAGVHFVQRSPAVFVVAVERPAFQVAGVFSPHGEQEFPGRIVAAGVDGGAGREIRQTRGVEVAVILRHDVVQHVGNWRGIRPWQQRGYYPYDSRSYAGKRHSAPPG